MPSNVCETVAELPRDRVGARLRGATLAVGAMLASILACNGELGESSARTDRRGEVRVVVVTHGQSSDPFWSVVANGVREAADDLGVRTEYQAPGSFDMVEMSEIIEAVVASRPDGLVVSIPDPDALGSSIRAAVDAGIPVISINSGSDSFTALGVLAHVGQTEYEAGFAAGERMAIAGTRQALCVNHEVGNIALDRRCEGFGDALAIENGSMAVLAVDLADPDDARERIAGALASDPTIDGILTLGPTGAEPGLAALTGTGRFGSITFGTFDLSPRVLEAVRKGEITFAIDQQQYLQGYLSVVLVVKYLETLTVPGGDRVIRTGPRLVTGEVAESVIEMSRRGLR